MASTSEHVSVCFPFLQSVDSFLVIVANVSCWEKEIDLKS